MIWVKLQWQELHTHRPAAWSVLVYGYNRLHRLQSCSSLHTVSNTQKLWLPSVKVDHLGITGYELYILLLKRSSHDQQALAANPPSTNGTGHTRISTRSRPHQSTQQSSKKLQHLEWNTVAFAPVSSITLCANTILEVSAIYF